MSQIPRFSRGLLDGILVKNIKSFIEFPLRLCLSDFADFVEMVLEIFAGLGIGLPGDLRNEAEKILMMNGVVVIVYTE